MKLETQEQKQTKVVVLSHVKESSIVYSESVTTTTSSKRIAWPGGNITSNKHEALLKFYQRKIMNGELNEHQLKAAQAALGKDFERISQMTSSEKSFKPTEATSTNDTSATRTKTEVSEKKYQKNKKVSGQNLQKVFIINGRIVGPKANKNDQQRNRSRVYPTTTTTTTTTTSFMYSKKQSKNKQKKQQKQKHPKLSIALHDQLGMSLDALANRKKK